MPRLKIIANFTKTDPEIVVEGSNAVDWLGVAAIKIQIKRN
jgi:hypothetical protein